jgi:hypothetical protein
MDRHRFVSSASGIFAAFQTDSVLRAQAAEIRYFEIENMTPNITCGGFSIRESKTYATGWRACSAAIPEEIAITRPRPASIIWPAAL